MERTARGNVWLNIEEKKSEHIIGDKQEHVSKCIQCERLHVNVHLTMYHIPDINITSPSSSPIGLIKQNYSLHIAQI